MGRTSSGTILLAFVAILCGLLGTYAIRKLARPRPVAKKDAPQLVSVPLAGADIPAGRTITLGDIVIVRMSREQMAKQEVQYPFMSDTRQIIGRTLREGRKRGETFDTQHFYPEGMGPGVAEQLHAGERAVTVTIADEHGLIGFAGAGQIVDVLFHASAAAYSARRYRSRGSGYGRGSHGWGGVHMFGDEQRGMTSTLMQGVRVLALGNDTFAPVKNAAAARRRDELQVTLAVSPEQAETLRVVQGFGELSLSLRNPDDGTSVQLGKSRTLDDVLDIPHNRVDEMEVYRGQQVQHLMFDRTSSISHRYGANGWLGQGAAKTETEVADKPDAATPFQIKSN